MLMRKRIKLEIFEKLAEKHKQACKQFCTSEANRLLAEYVLSELWDLLDEKENEEATC